MQLFAFPGFEILPNGKMKSQLAVFEFPRMEFDGPQGTRIRIHVQPGDLVLVGVSRDKETWAYVGAYRGTAFAPGAAIPGALICAIQDFFSALFKGEANLFNVRYLPANVKEEAPPAPAKKAELKIQSQKRVGEAPPAPVAAVSKTLAIAGR